MATTSLTTNHGVNRQPLPYRTALALTVALALIALGRIASNYHRFPQAYDEPAHIACGMEWLDKGTYRLEALHPPLARVAGALGPYLAGVRLPEVRVIQAPQGPYFDIFFAGDDILNTGGHYWRNLILARLGEIPFLALGVCVVFYWTRSLSGNAAAVFAVFLFTTVPSILAFAGLAYVDFSLAVSLPLLLLGYALWLERRSLRLSLALGASAGLAMLCNFTAPLFAAVCMLPITLCWWWLAFRKNERAVRGGWMRGTIIALVAAAIVTWAGYRFAMPRLDQAFAKPAQDVASLRGMPGPLKKVAARIVAMNPPIPAPEFLRGVLSAWNRNENKPVAYTFGKVRRGGVWYFYWVVLALKTPLPFLLLAMAGIGWALAVGWRRDWRLLVAPVSALAILLLAMTVDVNLGIRHILFIYPLLAVSAAGGAYWLWQLRSLWPRLAPAMLVGVLAWQGIASAAAHPDYIPYVNLLAGKHPENILLFGCDFDCGQDLARLSQALPEHNISHLSLRLWTSADLKRWNLPDNETLPPYQHTTGWIAVSVLHLRTGEAIWRMENPDAYKWLEAYPPMAIVGKTIWLYNIPPGVPASISRPAGRSRAGAVASNESLPSSQGRNHGN